MSPTAHQDIDSSLQRALAGADGGAEPSLTISGSPAAPGELVRRLGYIEGRELGRGGLGRVVEANQQAFDRTVAIKRLLAHGDRDAALRFYAEAMISAQLEHPHIVPIHDLLADADGNLSLVMKRVEGRSWKAALASDDPPTLDENLDILLQVCEAVAFAHHRGFIHRDLKPENVMLGDYGEVAVMDWGCALAFGDREVHPVIPRTDEVTSIAGSPAYMAPEMVVLEPNRLGPRSDVWLLGGILYELLTGTKPNRGTTVMEALRHAALGLVVPPQERAPDRAIPKELAKIAMAALTPDPDQRTPDVTTFAKGLTAYRVHAGAMTLADECRLLLAQPPHDLRLRRAVSAIENAVALWPEWAHARRLHHQAALAWAKHCLATGGAIQAEALARQAAQAAHVAKDTEGEKTARSLAAKARVAALAATGRERALRIARLSTVGGALALALLASGAAIWIQRSDAATRAALAESEAARVRIGEEQAARKAEQIRYAPALLAQARTEISAARPEAAEPALRAALAFDPDLAEAAFLHAAVLAALGRFPEAAEACHRRAALPQAPPDLTDLMTLCQQGLGANAAVIPARLTSWFLAAGLPGLVDTRLLTPQGKLAAYQARLELAWPGSGNHLLIDERGHVHYAHDKGFFNNRKDISDLTALRALPFKELSLTGTAVADLTPLRGMPLRKLAVNRTPVRDLLPLTGLPLTDLDISECPQVDLATLPKEGLRRLTAFNLRAPLDPQVLAGLRLEELLLNGLPATEPFDLAPLAGMPLRILHLRDIPVPDLAPLRGMPLESLSFACPEADLTPLAGMSLRHLDIAGADTFDFTPVSGTALTSLLMTNVFPAPGTRLDHLHPTEVELRNYRGSASPLSALSLDRLKRIDLLNLTGMDLTPLSGAPLLTEIRLGYSQHLDLTCLRSVGLKHLRLQSIDATTWATLGSLRDIPTLDLITLHNRSMAASAFWKTYRPDQPFR